MLIKHSGVWTQLKRVLWGDITPLTVTAGTQLPARFIQTVRHLGAGFTTDNMQSGTILEPSNTEGRRGFLRSHLSPV